MFNLDFLDGKESETQGTENASGRCVATQALHRGPRRHRGGVRTVRVIERHQTSLTSTSSSMNHGGSSMVKFPDISSHGMTIPLTLSK